VVDQYGATPRLLNPAASPRGRASLVAIVVLVSTTCKEQTKCREVGVNVGFDVYNFLLSDLMGCSHVTPRTNQHLDRPVAHQVTLSPTCKASSRAVDKQREKTRLYIERVDIVILHIVPYPPCYLHPSILTLLYTPPRRPITPGHPLP